MADTVTVIRLGERKMRPVSLLNPLLIPDEAFMCRLPILKDTHYIGTVSEFGMSIYA